MVVRLALAALLCMSWPSAVLTAPARIIILRHGEKADKWKLCDIGQERADALAANYLGRDAANSLFASGDQPAAFLAITLHTLELAYPAASTWNQPIILYPVMPERGADEDKVEALNRRTQEAARDNSISLRASLRVGRVVPMIISGSLNMGTQAPMCRQASE